MHMCVDDMNSNALVQKMTWYTRSLNVAPCTHVIITKRKANLDELKKSWISEIYQEGQGDGGGASPFLSARLCFSQIYIFHHTYKYIYTPIHIVWDNKFNSEREREKPDFFDGACVVNKFPSLANTIPAMHACIKTPADMFTYTYICIVFYYRRGNCLCM